MAPSPYNPLKKQNDLHSHGVRAQLRPRPLKERQKLSGPSLRIGDFSLRAGLRQLSERVYLPPPSGLVGGDTAFGMSGMQTPNRLL